MIAVGVENKTVLCWIGELGNWKVLDNLIAKSRKVELLLRYGHPGSKFGGEFS